MVRGRLWFVGAREQGGAVLSKAQAKPAGNSVKSRVQDVVGPQCWENCPPHLLFRPHSFRTPGQES